ncbi:lysozyme inhibitor LprI family protein [Achromobacter sp. MY14]|uniref:lysozyme inhibitor LprI family protein n=1 Tax=unclassified Achromobacter TaxID=2626865 RepID=UPI001E44FCC4|nr:lysozyme inhibitor LprI family protein [Achromobacter sp. MY14]MCD0495724.1 lysozyme inhibitor LprI family protein [Achromobacter sp. MY14]
MTLARSACSARSTYSAGFAVKGLFLAGVFALSAPAMAINCAKAGTAVEKLICADKATVAADAGLNRAYQAILKQAPDDSIRAMLVASQKRWLEARDRALDRLLTDQDAVPDDKTAGEIARELIENRRAQFQEAGKGSATPTMIRRAVQQQFQSQFTGGAFAGYWTSCDVLPRDYVDYACFAIRHYQNNDRVCSVDESWASGAVYTKRYVANVVNGKPRVIASCSFNSADEACATVGDTKANWNREPEAPKYVYADTPLPKVDGEIDASDDAEWVQACLTDPAYPPGQ